MSPQIEIAGRSVGPNEPVFVVAELSANHNGKLEEAVRLVHAAKAAGADAVKVQTYTPETMTLRSDDKPFRIGKGTAWEGRNLFDLYGESHMPWAWYPALAEAAKEAGLILFSTPFDPTAVAFLERMNAPAYKIASFELVDLPLLRCVAATGKPVILSTGMATAEEIEEAVDTLRLAGAPQIALLKCTSAYPAIPEEMNLRAIPDMAARFGVPIGLSDHTMDTAVPVAAVTLGACIIEKHLTLSGSVPGPDSEFSLEPKEFREMVDAVRTAQAAQGSAVYGPSEHERPALLFRRSLFVVLPVRAGEPFTHDNVRAIRPSNGLHPRYLDRIIGRVAAKDLQPGTPLQWHLIADDDAEDPLALETS
jgi:pseudaminic acid synthase